MKGMGRGMNFVKKGLDNQAIGLLPLLAFMILDNYLSYLVSFLIGVSICFVCILLFQVLTKNRVYLFMLLPSAGTLILYGGFLSLRLDPILFVYTPLIIEILLVVCLTFIGLTRRSVFKYIRNSDRSRTQKTLLRTTLNEFYFVSQLVQNLYTLHLFAVLLYSFYADTLQTEMADQFLYRYVGALLGVLVIIYEHVRISWMQGSLKKEMWLPVLNDKGKVIGCIARSVSRSLPKKYYHPVVRIAVLYEDMLYLAKRSQAEYVAPGTLDYPFHRYVLFRQTFAMAVKEALGKWGEEAGIVPHFLVRYTYEDEQVKHLVSLYTITLQTEKQLNECKQRTGKLWTVKQIEDNLNKGVFSSYFEKEFPYLQSTVLLARTMHSGTTPEAPGSALSPRT